MQHKHYLHLFLMNFKFLLPAVLLVWAVLPLWAQDESLATNASTPLAEKLVSLMHFETNFDAMKGKMGALLTSQKPAGVSQDAWDQVTKQSQQTMESVFSTMTWEKMKAVYISLYAETFSPAELQGLIDFYKTPVGQKWIEKQPQMQAQIMMKMQVMMKDIMPAIMKSGGMPAGSGSSAPIQPVQTTDKAPSPNPTP